MRRKESNENMKNMTDDDEGNDEEEERY